MLSFAGGLLLWKICTGVDPESWILGLPAAGLFAWFVQRQCPPDAPRIHFRALPGFLLYFLLQSFRTGLDVARRALSPGSHVSPGYARYLSRLPEGAPQAIFANLISLLPGTLCWSLADGVHKIHWLSENDRLHEELAELEERVARLYGLHLECAV